MANYISTRGQSPAISFADAALRGLAPDGGLYLPESWPTFTQGEIKALINADYQQLAFAIMQKFIGDDVPPTALKAMIKEAYDGFHHPSVCPLFELDHNFWVMENIFTSSLP